MPRRYELDDGDWLSVRFPGGRNVEFEDFDSAIGETPGFYVSHNVEQALTEIGWLAESFAKIDKHLAFDFMAHDEEGQLLWSATAEELIADGYRPVRKHLLRHVRSGGKV